MPPRRPFTTNELPSMEAGKLKIYEALEQAMSTLVISPEKIQLTRNILTSLKDCDTDEQFEAIALFADQVASLRHKANSTQEIRERASSMTQKVLKTIA